MQNLRSNFPTFTGEYKIVTLKAKPETITKDAWLDLYRKGLLKGWVKKESPVIKNKIVFNDSHGVNLIIKQLAGDTTYPLAITNASIGKGTTTPADSDTDLETPILENIILATVDTSLDTVATEWFIIDSELPNDTYTEFGIFCGTKLFARSIITPSHTKSSNEDTLVLYSINAGNNYTA